MSDIVIDTNIVIWYFADPSMLSADATQALDDAEATSMIYVSTMTLIELVYLTEKGRIDPSVLPLLQAALNDPTTAFRSYDIHQEVADAVSQIIRTVVPELPDRVIAATALYLNIPLVTADRKIQAAQNIQTIW
jgi:PIN domain nuclease of toxin-antitoxin system